MSSSRRQFIATGAAAAAGATTFWSISALGAKAQPITASHSVNTTIYAAHMVANTRGFMEGEGLTMHVIEARGGSNVRRILAAGQVGYALGDSSHPLQLTNRGRASKILMATDNRCSYANIIARKELVDKGIDTVEKLAEHKREDGSAPVIAATGIGSGTWVYGTFVLEQLGVDDRFNWVAGGGSKTMLGGLKTGKFDAMMAVPAWRFAAEDGGFGALIYDISDESSWTNVFGGTIPASVIYVLDHATTNNAEITQKYVTAMYKAMRWLESASVDEVYAAIAEDLPRFTAEQVKKEIVYYKNIWRYDGGFTQADFDTGAKVWFRAKTKIAALSYEDVADMSFLEAAKKAA
ncbi:MAG: ABC transporter substrate-binding protein [Gammaproteobacteria bacterium]